jgi:hypothetical protein
LFVIKTLISLATILLAQFVKPTRQIKQFFYESFMTKTCFNRYFNGCCSACFAIWENISYEQSDNSAFELLAAQIRYEIYTAEYTVVVLFKI